MGLKRVRGTRSHGSLYYGSTTDSISVPCLSVSEPVLERVFEYWKNIDQEVGERIEKSLKKN